MKHFLSPLRYCLIMITFVLIFVLTNTKADSNLSTDLERNRGSQESVQIPEISTPKIEEMIDVGG